MQSVQQAGHCWHFDVIKSRRVTWSPDISGIIIETSGIQLPRNAPGNDPFALPLRLVYPGFAINMIFYAAILWVMWLLFAAPWALRRRRRIKRGLCPACAYPIGSNQLCTECG